MNKTNQRVLCRGTDPVSNSAYLLLDTASFASVNCSVLLVNNIPPVRGPHLTHWGTDERLGCFLHSLSKCVYVGRSTIKGNIVNSRHTPGHVLWQCVLGNQPLQVLGRVSFKEMYSVFRAQCAGSRQQRGRAGQSHSIPCALGMTALIPRVLVMQA